MLLLTAMLWGLTFVAQRLGMDSVGPFTFMAMKSLLAMVCLWGIVYIMKVKGLLRGIDWRKHIKVGVVCGVVLTIAGNLQQIGLVDEDAGKTGFITALYIVIVPMFGLFMKKKSTPFHWIGVVLGVIGLYFISVAGTMHMSSADIVILIGAFFWALDIIVVDNYALDLNGVVVSAVQFTVIAFSSLAIAVPVEDITLSGVQGAALAIIYCGTFGSTVAYTLQIIGQKGANPTVASLIMSTEAMWSLVFGMILLGETLTGREGFGCIVMFAAVIIAQLPYKKGSTKLP